MKSKIHRPQEDKFPKRERCWFFSNPSPAPLRPCTLNYHSIRSVLPTPVVIIRISEDNLFPSHWKLVLQANKFRMLLPASFVWESSPLTEEHIKRGLYGLMYCIMGKAFRWETVFAFCYCAEGLVINSESYSFTNRYYEPTFPRGMSGGRFITLPIRIGLDMGRYSWNPTPNSALA